MKKTTTTTIGCDLGDKTSELFVLHGDGRTETGRVRNTEKALRKWFDRPAAHVVIEVGAHSRWASELLRDLGHRVTVANPRRVQLISQNDSKSDRTDAELLARLGRADTALLSPIQHRGRQAQTDLAVAKSRDRLVECRTRLVNHVRGVTKSVGLRLPSCTAESFHRRTRLAIPADLRAALDPIYTALEQLGQQIKALDEQIQQLAKKYPDTEVLAQPHGVGILTALVFLLTIEDKSRLPKSRMAGAFLGLRPRRDQSGVGDPQLRITKAGDPFVRRLLVNGANYILGPFGADSDLRRWGMRLAERGGKNARKRAKVAVARKLAVLMHRLWTTGEVYEPLGYATKSKAA